MLRPEQIEPRIAPEERERRGVAEPTWVAAHGKVHPDVRAILATGQMPWARFRGWAPIGFEGTAYVAIHLRAKPGAVAGKAAIEKLQRGVLSRLTAAEFSLVYAFKQRPVLLGYVDRQGLEKLEQDSEVVAVGLDDAPVPADPPRLSADAQTSYELRGRVERAVYEALQAKSAGYVFVSIDLTPVALKSPYDRHALDVQRTEERELAKRVLARLTADEFRLRTRGGGLAGYANAAGVAKLAEHPDVRCVRSDHGPVEPLGSVKRGRG